jgi:phosphatidylglycerol:prolipoprotein diacylglycerol transferase
MTFLLCISRKLHDKIKSGSLFLIYVIFYGTGRVVLEGISLDVSLVQGVNINQVIMGLITLGAILLLYFYQRNNQSLDRV